ncbi:DUF4287 domain-containing protein [Demequina oxidasica]|uniref:DUF4287 domain-containing protein n=1 Tax=Demequina oxidasica TaxID=676199 RepID=UPI000781C753|nr:DUF4287 domain-containing protein [Demequina oxidasica]
MTTADAVAGGGADCRVPAPNLSGGPVQGPASYFPSIEKNYGKPIQDWLDVVASRPTEEKHSETVAWLKAEHGMGHGHANAVVAYVRAKLGR